MNLPSEGKFVNFEGVWGNITSMNLRRLLVWLVVLSSASLAAGEGLGDLTLGPAWLDSSAAVASHAQVTPGQQFHIALDLHLAKGWTYDSPDPGPEALAADLDVQAGKLATGQPLWPVDKPVTVQVGSGSMTSNAYQGRVIVYVPVTVPKDLPAGDYEISLTPDGQVCSSGKNGQCIPLSGPNAVTEKVRVKVGSSSVADEKWNVDKDLSSGLAAAMTVGQLRQKHGSVPGLVEFLGYQDITLFTALGLALLAGLILNIMPCVLPVIPLKVLSIAEMAGESRWRLVKLGLAFMGGIMLFFLGLAVVSFVLRSATQYALNWGEHFQNTGFRIAMAMVVIAVAANLFGVFTVTVPGRVTSIGGSAGGPHHSTLSALGGGILTAVLSTPCSFGYLTFAFGWAQSQPAWLGSLAILAIGVGMASPYVILIAFPGLIARLPRPGRWMELFKQSMGFVMLIVAIWLIGTITADTYITWVAAYGAVLAFCLWIWGSWVRYDATPGRKIAIRGIAAALAVAGGIWMLQPPQPLAVHFEPFDASRIAAARAQGQIVLVDFTANWCATCKTVEYTVYDKQSVAAELRARNILAIKGDITTKDLPANKMLFDQLKEPGVPVSIVFPPGDGKPIRLHGIFSQEDLLRALDEASGKK